MLFRVLLFFLGVTAITEAQALGDSDFFSSKIKPILDSRCVQCHSCYNAPCQLNMSSVEGLDRGLVKNFEVYSTRTLQAEEPSRLGIDRKTAEEWQNFSPVHKFRPVTEDTESPERNLASSYIYQLTEHKRTNPHLALNDLLNMEKEQAESSRVCPETPTELAAHLKNRPNAGMPYGLPPLEDGEMRSIKTWTEMGSPRSQPDPAAPASDVVIKKQVESFFNAYTSNPAVEEAKKQSLVSRYIYEHLFLANISLSQNNPTGTFYRLIRSRMNCDSGTLDEYATRRPWDDPQGKFYYCLKKVNQTIMHKTHLAYILDERRLARWQELFSGTWSVRFKEETNFLNRIFGNKKEGWTADLAPREDKTANNPMYVFRDIPVKSRYQFLLDDAEYHVNTFIRGPVCKGNTAVNSIDEQFYVFFVKPESDLMVRRPEFAERTSLYHRLPAYKGSDTFDGLGAFYDLQHTREMYRRLRDQNFRSEFPHGLGIDDIWDGQSESDKRYLAAPNRNAALTVFRNYDSAAVAKGLIGATSKTVFLVDYSILERLVYDLVTGFDVYGNVAHQVLTRIYMSYLRMEAEENFLNLMPPSVRVPMRRSWYVPAHGITEDLANAVNTVLLRDTDKISRRYPLMGVDHPTAVNLPPFDEIKFYTLDGTAQESVLRSYRRRVVDQIRSHLGSALQDVGDLNPDKTFDVHPDQIKVGTVDRFADFETELARFSDLRALYAPWVLFMPDLAYVVVDGDSKSEIYTLIRNKEHFNIAWIAGETGRRNRAADSMTYYKGVLGSYPNHIFRIPLSQGQAFLQQMSKINDHASYESWLRSFGSPRNGLGSERFWPNSDHLHEVFKANYPHEYGAFDYNRYGVDYRFHKDGDVQDPLLKDLKGPMLELLTRLFGDSET